MPLLTGRPGNGGHGGPAAWLLDPETSRDEYVDGTGKLLSMGPQGGQISLERPGGSAWMRWDSAPESLGPRIDWRIGMEAGDGRRLLLEGRVAGLEPRSLRHLAVEIPLGTGELEDCYGYDRDGQRIELETLDSMPEGDWLGLIEEQAGVDWSLGWSPRSPAWRVRGVATDLVVPHWTFQADDTGQWAFRVELTVDTSAVQARQLGQLARRAA